MAFIDELYSFFGIGTVNRWSHGEGVTDTSSPNMDAVNAAEKSTKGAFELFALTTMDLTRDAHYAPAMICASLYLRSGKGEIGTPEKIQEQVEKLLKKLRMTDHSTLQGPRTANSRKSPRSGSRGWKFTTENMNRNGFQN